MTSSPSSDAPLRGLLLAAVSGVLYFLGFVGFGVVPLIFVCFVPVLLAMRTASPRRALGLGVIFGLVTNLGGYYWIIHLLREFAHLNLPLAVLGYVLLCLYQGSLLACVLWIVHRAKQKLGIEPVWSLPVAFVAIELVYPLIFPSYIGNALYRLTPLTQIVDVTGMLGLTALIGLVNGAAYELVCARGSRRPALARIAVPAAVVVLVSLYGMFRIVQIDAKTAATRHIDVALVQTNLGARDKEGRRDEFIERHRAMSVEAVREHPEIDLLVWPESAYNRWIERTTRNLRAEVTGAVDRPVLFGGLTYAQHGKSLEKYNSALLVDGRGDVLGIFDKVVLLMFGETIPLVETFPIIEEWFPHSSTFTRGKRFKHLALEDKSSFLPMVCYEDIVPALVRLMWTEAGPAHALVNITNDSWYGDTHEPLIHLALATFRSIETRRALIRSTNTGISAIVDPVGRIGKRTGQWTQETLIAAVPMIEDGSSTIYMTIGDLIGWIAVALVGVLFIKSRRTR